jgi:hypothetical protein
VRACVCVCVFVITYFDLTALHKIKAEDIYTFCFNIYAVEQLIDALRYKTKGRGFDSRQGLWNISLT